MIIANLLKKQKIIVSSYLLAITVLGFFFLPSIEWKILLTFLLIGIFLFQNVLLRMKYTLLLGYMITFIGFLMKAEIIHSGNFIKNEIGILGHYIGLSDELGVFLLLFGLTLSGLAFLASSYERRKYMPNPISKSEKIKSREIFQNYFNSIWIPSIYYITSLLLFIGNLYFGLWILNSFFTALMGTFFLGLLSASVWNLIKKQWLKGILNFGFTLTSLIVTIIIVLVLGFFGPSDDHFADFLTIPDNIDFSVPNKLEEKASGGPEDTFQLSLLKALKTSGNEDSSVTADIGSLLQLHRNNPDILKRYLATSPAWRVFTEKGNLFATRRMMIGPLWRYTLHGYYSNHDFDLAYGFQSRVTIGLSGKPWARHSESELMEGETAKLALSTGNQMDESWCLIKADGLYLEIFEQSEAKERRMTKAALAYLENELRPMLKSPEWKTIKDILPPGSIRRSKPDFQLWESFQPGVYDTELWLNPGEPGMIYLKAFEVTRNYELSARDLKEYSNEWIGWSEDYSEMFFSNTQITINEGDWGKPYAARFEVWFVPDSGGPERKLLEKIFKIEGWQR